MPSINEAGLQLIESFEGCELRAYQDTGGVWTIGFGHTAGVCDGDTITQTQADEYLEADIQSVCDDVQKLVQVVLSPNQFAALVSFDYNTGALSSSPGLTLVNENKGDEAWENHFCLYIHDAAGNALEGLVRRRAAEYALWKTP